MGTKVIHTGDLSALPLLTEVLEADDGRLLLTDRLLNSVSTSGAGDISDVTELSYLIHEMIQYCLFINSQDYDIEAATQALLAARGV